MKSKEVTIELASGLEARPVAMLVQVASQYESRLYMEYANKKVNAKSIMGMMAFGLKRGMEVRVTVDGKDEADAMAAIEKQLGRAC